MAVLRKRRGEIPCGKGEQFNYATWYLHFFVNTVSFYFHSVSLYFVVVFEKILKSSCKNGAPIKKFLFNEELLNKSGKIQCCYYKSSRILHLAPVFLLSPTHPSHSRVICRCFVIRMSVSCRECMGVTGKLRPYPCGMLSFLLGKVWKGPWTWCTVHSGHVWLTCSLDCPSHQSFLR